MYEVFLRLGLWDLWKSLLSNEAAAALSAHQAVQLCTSHALHLVKANENKKRKNERKQIQIIYSLYIYYIIMLY